MQYAKGEGATNALPRRMFGTVSPSGDVQIVITPASFTHIEERSQITYASGRLLQLPSATSSSDWHDMEPCVQETYVFELRMHSFVGRATCISKVTYMVPVRPVDSEWIKVPGTRYSIPQLMTDAGWPVSTAVGAEVVGDESRSKLLHAYFNRLHSFDKFNDLEGKFFYYPHNSLSALQMDINDGETSIYKVQSVWKITFSKGGYIFGEVSSLAYEEGDEEPSPTALRVFGTVAPSGQTSLFCTPTSFQATQTTQMTSFSGSITQQGKSGSPNGRWQLVLQMQSFSGSSNSTLTKLAIVSQVNVGDKDWHQLPGIGLGVREMRMQAGWNVLDA